MNNKAELERLINSVTGRRVLLLTTSTRWSGSSDVPKSTQLAEEIASRLGDSAVIMNVPDMHIYQCEGNVSDERGNGCGVKAALLKDDKKNPSGFHRCWASFNHSDDELWKISKELFEADVVLFFGSVRWGSANGVYQKLIERLTWLENRHSALDESNLLEGKQAGIILTGHNWRVGGEVDKQKQVFEFFGFDVPAELSFYWQWTHDANDETLEGYKRDTIDFHSTYDQLSVNESYEEFIKRGVKKRN